MALAPGVRLGAYEIVSLIGAGGMGEVYRARDSRLGRDVAIKVLPEMFSADADRLARFKREAHVLASLNHPNIASIHGLEETLGGNALVLELVEGPTLADRIAQGRIPLDEALPIARQIAEALEAAHEHGIVHRDLKPANVKITDDGQVKVLDFGLAKAADTGSVRLQADLSVSPTITSPAMTIGGVILGTAAYMSPEQAKGKPVDRRSDMWAFGCVLYEMLTGVRAFEGEDVSDTLAEILKSEPDLKRLPPHTPPAITRLLRRCLVKDRKMRLADAGAARIEIDEAGASAGAVAPPARATRTPIVAAALASVVAAGAIAVAVTLALRPEPAKPLRRFAIEFPLDKPFMGAPRRTLALSPDGSRLVFAANQRLNMRQMSSVEPVAIQGTDGAAMPFFSPDGRSLAFLQGGQLKKMDVMGGPALRVCDTPLPYGASWEHDNFIWFGRAADGIWKVPAEPGGAPVQVIKMDASKAETAELPQLLPGGEWVLFTLNSADTVQATRAHVENAQLVVQSLRTHERKILIAGGADGRYLSSGHIVYVTQGSLAVVSFDLDRLMVTGKPVYVVDQVFHMGGVGVSGGGVSTSAQFTVSSEGTLAYVPPSVLGLDRTIVWVDRAGNATPIAGAPTRTFVYPRISPDGSQIALDIRGQDQGIHIWDLSRANLRRLTFEPGEDIAPVWSPDGRRIIYSGVRRGVFSRAADGTGTPQTLLEGKFLYGPTDMTPDGNRLLMNENQMATYDIKAIDIGTDRSLKSVLDTSVSELNGVLSPDGKFMVYQSNESGRMQIYVRPYPDVQSGQWLISSGGGIKPAWRGQEIFYLGPQNTMMVVPVKTDKGLRHGTPEPLFSLGSYWTLLAGRTYDVTADGQKFLMIKMSEPGTTIGTARGRIVIVQNWLEDAGDSNPNP